MLVRHPSDWQKARSFIGAAWAVGSDVYAEELVDYDKEVALVGVLSVQGHFVSYPLVETIQTNQICTSAIGPASPDLHHQAEQIAHRIAADLGLVGSFAVEFFVRGSKLLVNEMAPRVHNSGHVTMDGAKTSQFENHIRAVYGLPLGSVETSKHFGMINILGPDGVFHSPQPPRIVADGIRVHWYHKPDSRPGRKIGHINIWADDHAQFDHRMRVANTGLATWSANLEKGKT